MEKCLSEVISELANRAVEVRPHQVQHALKMGRIDKPRMSGSLNYLFSPRQVDALERYFRNPVQPGRPKKTTA